MWLSMLISWRAATNKSMYGKHCQQLLLTVPHIRFHLSRLNGATFFPLVLCKQERLLALKRSMSFMQDMDFTQQAAILGDEDLTADVTPPEIIPIPVESAKKSRKQPVKDMKEVIRYSSFEIQCLF